MSSATSGDVFIENTMKKAKWIWNGSVCDKDAYCEFTERFCAEDGKAVLLRIACDGMYAAYVNGTLAAFSQCADFPHCKFYDEIDVTKYCRTDNELKIVVWHLGENSQTYISDTAGVLFEVECNGKIAAYSSAHTHSRRMNEYRNGYCKVITRQLGFAFLYDNTVAKSEYTPSTEVRKTSELHRRSIRPLVLEDRLPVHIVKREKSILIDMGREVAGFLDLDIESETEQKWTIAYGEHIADGGVRRKIGTRDFSVEFIARKGENVYLNPLRRLAGRYLEIFCDNPIEIRYAGIRPVNYPVVKKNVRFADESLQRIYDVSVDTLRLCMHEHYEDCPWREQALYTMDSRNQMLCGYYAFEGGNQAYARHNLVLISKSLRPDGLLSICAPSGTDVPIPFFSLVYIWQVYEYIEHTQDRSILDEVGETMDTIMRTFSAAIDASGLIPSFAYPYWNFYEWAEESDDAPRLNGIIAATEKPHYDLILNGMFVYVLSLYGEITEKKTDIAAYKEAVKKTFYRNGVFVLSTATERYSQLGNAIALLIGLGDEELSERILTDKNMIPATLAMKAFVYDVLLTFGNKYKDYILQDIRKTYGKMLYEGATTFWETAKGESDFDGAGSLCHGWSAIPAYYLHIL